MSKLKPVSNHNNNKITNLKQEINYENQEIIISIWNSEYLPELKTRSIALKLDAKYQQKRLLIAKNLYRGFKENDDVNKWFSKVLGIDVWILRAEKDRYLTMNRYRMPKANENDRRSGFITDGALHVINV